MGLLTAMREQRRRQAMSERYVAALLASPPADQVTWLASAGGIAPERAAFELSLAQRAIGLIVAERDALDDQTAADVSHAIDAVVAAESRARKSAVADWTSHWRQYAEALAERGRSEPPLGRIARAMLRGAGVAEPGAAELAQATAFVTAFRKRANEALRAVYGAATLPEDRPPSALLRERSGQH